MERDLGMNDDEKDDEDDLAALVSRLRLLSYREACLEIAAKALGPSRNESHIREWRSLALEADRVGKRILIALMKPKGTADE